MKKLYGGYLLLRFSVVDRLLTLICMIPKVNFGDGEMGLMFCDLYVSLK